MITSPWPPEGPFRTAALRIPRTKDELEMTLHGAVAALEPGGVLLAYGANDEGARSAPGRIEPLVGEVVTVQRMRRCRVLRAVRPADTPGLRPRLEEWRRTTTLSLAGEERSWVSYPGIFAHGRLDPGTALLLEHLPPLAPDARVLDFGCGSGPVGAAVRARSPSAPIDLLDADAVALRAAEENVEGARIILGTSLDAAAGPYDAIVSNPPYHAGRAETTGVAEALIRDAPSGLTGDGVLALVVQKRLGLEEPLRRAFRRVDRPAADRTYAVFVARKPGRG
ncbi:MAG TPA: methyltransferase [Longimicrobiales bacterium]|nr:methyltransferase [Longimicrobiales bacterium]